MCMLCVWVSVCVGGCGSKSESERDERNEIRKWRRVEKFFELPKKEYPKFLLRCSTSKTSFWIIQFRFCDQKKFISVCVCARVWMHVCMCECVCMRGCGCVCFGVTVEEGGGLVEYKGRNLWKYKSWCFVESWWGNFWISETWLRSFFYILLPLSL